MLNQLTIAIAHPLHPPGGNANGTGKHDASAKSLFTSPMPLIMVRFLHRMDVKFMRTSKDKIGYSRCFDGGAVPPDYPFRSLGNTQEPTLPRAYSSEAMDDGEGMLFHPLVGTRLEHMEKCDRSFAKVIPAISSWFNPFGCDYEFSWFIGDGKSHPQGGVYPYHWRYDPYTGKRI